MADALVPNLVAFDLDLRNAEKELTDEQWVPFVKKIVLDLLRLIVFGTPVRTGRLRGNWQVDIDIVPSGTLATTDKAGRNTIRGGLDAVRKLEGFETIYLANNLVYAIPVDEKFPILAPALATIRGIFP